MGRQAGRVAGKQAVVWSPRLCEVKTVGGRGGGGDEEGGGVGWCVFKLRMKIEAPPPVETKLSRPQLQGKRCENTFPVPRCDQVVFQLTAIWCL